MLELQTAHGWRFSLRTLLVAMAIVALAAINWKFLYYLGVAGQLNLIFSSAMFCVVALAWNLGQSGPPYLAPQSRPAQLLAVVWLTLFGTMSLYLVWTHFRFYELIWSGVIRAFPYPDQWLFDLHDWLDRRNPAPPGYIKIHGEVDLIHVIVNYAAWLAAALFAFQSGLWFRVDRREMFSLIRGFITRAAIPND